MFRTIRHLAEYFVFRLIICIIQALPAHRAFRMADVIAGLFAHVLPRKITRYKVARENLRQAFGTSLSDEDADRIIAGMWRHLFRMVIEIAQMPRKVQLETILNVMNFEAESNALGPLCSGRPTILLSGHYGNWEIAVAVFGLFGIPMGVIARDLDNPWLHNWFARFRRATGHSLISKKGGYDEITMRLSAGGAVALLGDQDAGPSGIFVNFFGAPASTHKSIALLALEYDAIICVGYARRLPAHRDRGFPRFELGCAAVIDARDYTGSDAVREITQRYSDALEGLIRAAPDQYFWLHRRWKSQPRVRNKRLRAAA